jgi:hypothetical protein
MTEKELQEAVIACAKLFNWSVYHSWISVRSAPGFPDLILARAGRLLAWEVKSATGKLSPAQEEWLGVLGGVPCVETAVIRPDDWLGGDVERWLR